MSSQTISTKHDPLTIVCISDLHTLPLPPLPSGDLLFVAGDISEGTPSQLYSRLCELSALKSQYKHIIVIGGNHDRALDSNCDVDCDTQASGQDLSERISCRHRFRTSKDIVYLENSGTRLSIRNRSYSVWGSPGSLATSKRTAFGYSAEEADAYWAQVPSEVDLLVTHGPPAGYLDGGLGCMGLRDVLWKRRPRVHVFGHVHGSRGVAVAKYDFAQVEYDSSVTAALRSRMSSVGSTGLYIPRWKRPVQEPLNLKLPLSFGFSETELSSHGETVLVNSSYKGNGEKFGAIIIRLCTLEFPPLIE